MGPAPGSYATNREPLTPEEREAARRRRENTPPWTDVPKAMLEMYAAALRGVTKATLGAPGEIEDIFPPQRNDIPADNWRYLGGLLPKPTGRVFPTMKEVGEMLPPLHPRTLSSLVAEEPENPYETLGSFAPVGPKTIGQFGRAAAEGVRGLGGVTRSALSEALRPSTPFLQAGAINPRARKLAEEGIGFSPPQRTGKLAEVLQEKQPPMLAPSSESGALLPREPGGAEAQLIPAEQEPIPRLTPKGQEPRLNERSLALGRSKRAARAVDELIAKGRGVNPEMEFFYGSKPLQTFSLNEGLSQPEFERMIAQMSNASQRQPVPKENLLGSFLWGKDKRGEFTPQSQLWTKSRGAEGLAQDAPGVYHLPEGMGSLVQGDITDRARELALGRTPEEVFGPMKLLSYTYNKLGNEMPVTVDVNAVHHPVMVGGLTDWLKTLSTNKGEGGRIVSQFRPKADYQAGRLSLADARKRPGFWVDAPETPGEYKAFEDLWGGGAQRAGVSNAGGQALGWNSDLSGALTSMQHIEEGARKAAARLGVTPLEALRGFVQGKPGYQLGAGLIGGTGLAAAMSGQDADQYQ